MKIISFYYKDDKKEQRDSIFSNMKKRFFLNFKPFEISYEELFDKEFLKINFNYDKEYAKKNYEKNINTIEKIVQKYPEEVFLSDELQNRQDIIVSNGRIFSSLFIGDIIKYVCEEKGIDIAKCDVYFIDGNDFYSDICLEILKEELNFLSLITERKEDMLKYSDETLDYNGLNINVYGSEDEISFKDCDIIINCGKDNFKNDYAIKKDGIYIDLTNDKIKQYNILRKRDDIIFYNSFLFKLYEKSYNYDIIEAYYYSKYNFFRKFALEKRLKDIKRIKRMLKTNTCKLNKCFYKSII